MEGGGGFGGASVPPEFVGVQLTLFQPGRRQFMPTTLLLAPPDLKTYLLTPLG